MFEAIGRFSVKFRWLIVIGWIVLVPVLTANLPSITSVTKNNNSDFIPKNSPSVQATELETSFQRKDTANTTTIVATNESAPLTAEQNKAINAVAAKIKKQPHVTQVTDLGVSADGQARQIQVGIDGAGIGNDAIKVVNDLRDQLKPAPSGVTLHLTGELAQEVDSQASNKSGRNNTEIYTIIFILALLLVVFRSVLAPIVTLLPAGLALAVAQPVIAESTKIGVQVSFITEILLIVLVLGAGTDYGLFLVFRVREELRKGLAPKDAVVKALGKVGESITFSALTVAAALLSLVLASFGVYKGLGPALAISLGIMLLISLTFLPALLAILGRSVFWPSKTKATTPKIGLWGKVADKVIQRPVTMIIIGVAIFGGLSLGIIGYKTSSFNSGTAPGNSDSALGQQLVAKHFPAAATNPQLVILRFSEPVWNNLTAVEKAQNALQQSGDFKAVSGPFNANGFSLTPASLKALHDSNPKSPILQATAQFISSDGKTVQLYAIGNHGKSGSTEAINATPHLRQIVTGIGTLVGAKQSALYGTDSVSYDIINSANNDLKKIIPIVLLIIGVLLAALLRSLVAPWYLILTVGLSYLATLGFAMLVFVHFGGNDGLNFILPFMIFIFSMALGEDYNILVMSRIREESHGKITTKQAVTTAIGITGTTVTSAGLILAGTFGVLGLVGGEGQVQQIGYSIAFGILLDTFFVRTLLVPSVVVLLGRWNWWPSKLFHTTK